MTDIEPGDLVIAVPINDCRIGHPDWHREFAHPEMNSRPYMVTWAGFSVAWQRPIIGVAGREGRFCAGCFAKQKPPMAERKERIARIPERVS